MPVYPLGIIYFETKIMCIAFQKSFQFTLSLLDMKKIVPVEEGDYYLTPEGYRCFTEQFHLKRGYCCESGCRHCPYGFDRDKLKTN